MVFHKSLIMFYVALQIYIHNKIVGIKVSRTYSLTIYIYIYMMKTAGVAKNSGHCIYSIGLKCFCRFT